MLYSLTKKSVIKTLRKSVVLLCAIRYMHIPSLKEFRKHVALFSKIMLDIVNAVT